MLIQKLLYRSCQPFYNFSSKGKNCTPCDAKLLQFRLTWHSIKRKLAFLVPSSKVNYRFCTKAFWKTLEPPLNLVHTGQCWKHTSIIDLLIFGHCLYNTIGAVCSDAYNLLCIVWVQTKKTSTKTNLWSTKFDKSSKS